MDMHDHRQQVDQLQSSMQARQAELGRRILALEQQNLDLQQQLVQAQLGRDHKVREMQDKHGLELSRRQSVTQSSRSQQNQLRREVRDAERLAGEATTELRACQRQLEAAESENARIHTEHGQALEVYRAQLRRHAEALADTGSTAVGEDRQQLRRHVDNVLRDLAASHAQREQVLLLHSQRQAERHVLVRRALLDLRDAYREARAQLEAADMPVPAIAAPAATDDTAAIWQEDEPLPLQNASSEPVGDMASRQEVARLQAALSKLQQEAANLRLAASGSAKAAKPSPLRVADHLAADQWAELQAMLRSHTTKTQAGLERERGKLLQRCTLAEEVRTCLVQTLQLLSFSCAALPLTLALALQFAIWESDHMSGSYQGLSMHVG